MLASKGFLVGNTLRAGGCRDAGEAAGSGFEVSTQGGEPSNVRFFLFAKDKKKNCIVGMAAWWCCDGDAGSPVVEVVPECLFVDFF